MKKTFYRAYHIPGCPNYCRRPLNALVFSRANSNLHEISKSVAGLMIYKYGDVKITAPMIKAIRELADLIDVEMKDCEEAMNFISEAVPNDDPSRRVDIVRIEDNNRYEIETNHSIKKECCTTIYV
jgi:hypothetical protein